MKKIILFGLALTLIAASCNKSTLAKEKVLQVKYHKITVQLADTPAERARGLSGIPSISDNEGMLFLFSEPNQPQFWMKDMLFPIDIIWINNNKIVSIDDNVKPEPGKAANDLKRYSPPVPADMVLEVNAGWAYRKDVGPGDTIMLSNP